MKKFLLSIFALMLAVFSVQAEEVTFTAAGAGNVGTSGSGSEVVLENGAVKVVLSKAFGNGTQFRIYQNCTLTISATDATITNVSFVAYDGKTGAIALNEGGGSITSSGTTRSWAGSSNTVVLKANAQIRTQSITIKYTTVGEGGGETPETPVAPAAPTLPATCNFDDAMTVEITNIAEGATVYYTTDESDPATSGTRVEYTEPFIITETTTVKAIAVKDEMESSVAEATYTKVKLIDLNGCSVADAIEAYGNGQTGENATIVGYIVGAAANGSLAKAEFTSETEVASNILIADDPNETNVAKCMPIKLASGTTVRNVLNLPGNKGVYKKKVAIECKLGTYFSAAGTQDVSAAGIYWNVSEAGYTTLYLGYKAVIPETVKAYLATGVADKYVALSEVAGILPANTGLILEGEGEHLFNITSSAATVNVEANLLEGTVDATEIEEEAYVLGIVDEEVGLYKAKMAGGAWLNNANKAYLPASVVPTNVKSLSFRFGEGTTGIENVESAEAVKAIFDLTGRRVEAVTAPGIYIVNGKKVLVK